MKGNFSERERVIREYGYLCARGARKFLREGVDRRDLEQVAAIGLIKAADRFDASLGTPFEAYAWRLVLGELMHYVRDAERSVRIPRRMREFERRCRLAERDLCVRLGRDPNTAELARHLGATEADIREVQRLREHGMPLSVDALRPFEHLSLSYTIDRHLDHVAMQTSLKALSNAERKILREIYERDTPIAEIARALGYSRRHVTRLHHAALEKLRNAPGLAG
jgi:RNA polymerase sigma-B factor